MCRRRAVAGKVIGVGLWKLPGEWDDYEWFPVTDPITSAVAAPVDDDPATAMGQWLIEHLQAAPLWDAGDATRVLLVDLDNLRAAPSRLRARMTAVVNLARRADHVALAGQAGAVRRSSLWLDEFAGRAQSVADGSDLADLALLASAEAVTAEPVQFLVVSNDGIFASLAERGRLAVLSPGRDALSDRLRSAAHRLVDLAELEKQAVADRARARRQARRQLAAGAAADAEVSQPPRRSGGRAARSSPRRGR